LAKKTAAGLKISRSSVSVPDLATQPAQLVSLIRAQALGVALIDVELTAPVAQRLRRNTELCGELRHRLAAGSQQPDGLLAERQRIRRRHDTDLILTAEPDGPAIKCPRNRGNSNQPWIGDYLVAQP